MKIRFFALFLGLVLPFAAHASKEGSPVYYQNQTVNQKNAGYYKGQGYTDYIGQSGQKQVVGSKTSYYQVPKQEVGNYSHAMTTNGIAMPPSSEPAWNINAGYTRRFADFKFETGVNSILEWDDMVFNEFSVSANHNFSLRDFDLFAYAEYKIGSMSHGGISMDYDLRPFDDIYPEEGIFTISMGDMSGKTSHIRFGIGAKHIWDIKGWKLSPSIGYEIFSHDLQMSNHIYPNPGVYLPLMTDKGDYVFGDANGNYFTLPVGSKPPDNWYQVCMSPEDIKLVQAPGSGFIDLGTDLTMGDYDPTMGEVPWGVDSGSCVVIGGDGMIQIPGTTHIYNTTWSGIYVGLEMEKQMTLSDKLRFYIEVGMPQYSSEGTWPNRDDWQQNPSFIDKGSNGAYSYRAEMEYSYKMSERMTLGLRVETDYFYVGKIPGELYVAEYTTWQLDEFGQYVLDANDLPILETIKAHTEYIDDSLKSAVWQSFGLYLGAKYSF